MPRPIVVFGATGATGRLTAERLVAAGASPVLAGRNPRSLEALAERLGGLECRVADALRQNSVFDLVEDDAVLVSLVGPFVKWGEPAVRAAIAAGATYIDSTGEPVFIRRVFEEFGPAASRAGASLLTACGYDFVPGALAGALALQEAGPAAARVDVGYYSFGVAPTLGTRMSLVGAALDAQFAYRGGQVRPVRGAERVRTFSVKGRQRPAASVGGAEHYSLPAVFPSVREVNVYMGMGSLSRPLSYATRASSLALRMPGARTVAQGVGERLASFGEEDPEFGGVSFVVACAYDASGEELSQVELRGGSPYSFTAGFLAWAAARAASSGIAGAGAVGPVEAFGVDALTEGCRVAGLAHAAAPVG